MADILDKSLDDIVSSKRSSGRKERGGDRKERQDSTSRRPARSEARRGPRERQDRRGDRRQQRPDVRTRAPRRRDMDSGTWGHDGYERMAAMGGGIRIMTGIAGPAAAAAAAPAAMSASAMPPLRTSTKTKVSLINLDPEALESGLRSILETFGEVESVSIERNADGTSVGCGEAVFKNYDGAATAVKNLDGRIVDGRKLVVKVDPRAEAAAAAVAPAAAAAPGGRTAVILPGRGVAAVEAPYAAPSDALAHATMAFEETEMAGRSRMPRGGGYDRAEPRQFGRDDRRGRDRGDDRRGRDRGDDRRGRDRGDDRRGRGRDEDRGAARKGRGKRQEEDVEAQFESYRSGGKGEAKEGGRKGRKGKLVDESVDADFEAYVAAKGSSKGDAEE